MTFSLPKLFKYLSLVLFLGVLISIVIHLINQNGNTTKRPFDKKVLDPTLTAVSNDFRYAQTESNGVERFVITAKKDTAFTDGKHNLEDVHLEAHNKEGKPVGDLTAKTCEYDQQAQFANFQTDVVITTPEGLTIRTDHMKYDQATNSAMTDALVAFEKGNISGTCLGVHLDSQTERLIMVKNVAITVKPETPPAAGSAPPSTSSKTDGKTKSKEKSAKAAPVVPSEKTQAESTSGAPGEWLITGDHGEYWKKEKQVFLTGNAHLTRNGEEMKADRMIGYLDDNQRLQRLEARSQAFLKSDVKLGQIQSTDMDFTFTPAGDVEKAVAVGNVVSKTLGDGPGREAYGDTMEVSFVKGEKDNEVRQITTVGHARIKLLSPPPSPQTPQPAEKELSAHTIQVAFSPGGKFAETADADDNAVLTVLPTVVEPRADRKQIRAPHMHGIFFPASNQIQTFSAQGKVQVELTPLEANTRRLPKKTQSEKATATFERSSGEVAEVIQNGDFSFNEGVKNATADRGTYVAAKEVILLRGGRPTVWDDKARVQANEIDLSSTTAEHFGRGQVRTTYYNPGTAGNATPFTKTKSPVFITSSEAQANSQTGLAIFRGDARAWQDNNFIRGDVIELYQNEKRMVATGHVSSALYQTERDDGHGKKSVVPVFGTSERFTYSDPQHLAHYEKKVRVIQGEDTLTCASLDIFLRSESNEIDHLIAIQDVIITQPQRRATGNRAEYYAADNRYVIMGNSACVEDAERGRTTGPRLTFIKSDGSVLADDQGRSQRIRSQHRVQN